MTAQDVLTTVLIGLLPYIAPIIFFVGASIVAEKIINIISSAFGVGR